MELNLHNGIYMKSILLVIFIFLPQVVLAANDTEQGEKLYQTYCSACHGATGGMDMNKRVAPPLIAVRMHYIGTYPEKPAFVSAVADWVEKPDAGKTFMPGAIRRFNIMPPVSVSRQDAEIIAAYIYDGNIEKPAGFDKHFQEMHGQQRDNSGM